MCVASLSFGEIRASDRTDGAYKRKTVHLTSQSIVVNGVSAFSNGWGSVKVFDWREGVVRLHGAVADLTFTAATNLIYTNAGLDIAVGSAAVSDDNLTGATDANMVSAIAIDPRNSDTNHLSGFMQTLGQTNFNGTATALDAYVNMNVDSNDISAVVTGTISGTITFTYSNLGDY